MNDKIIIAGKLYPESSGTQYSGRVLSPDGIAFTLTLPSGSAQILVLVKDMEYDETSMVGDDFNE